MAIVVEGHVVGHDSVQVILAGVVEAAVAVGAGIVFITLPNAGGTDALDQLCRSTHVQRMPHRFGVFGEVHGVAQHIAAVAVAVFAPVRAFGIIQCNVDVDRGGLVVDDPEQVIPYQILLVFFHLTGFRIVIRQIPGIQFHALNVHLGIIVDILDVADRPGNDVLGQLIVDHGSGNHHGSSRLDTGAAEHAGDLQPVGNRVSVVQDRLIVRIGHIVDRGSLHMVGDDLLVEGGEGPLGTHGCPQAVGLVVIEPNFVVHGKDGGACDLTVGHHQDLAVDMHVHLARNVCQVPAHLGGDVVGITVINIHLHAVGQVSADLYVGIFTVPVQQEVVNAADGPDGQSVAFSCQVRVVRHTNHQHLGTCHLADKGNHIIAGRTIVVHTDAEVDQSTALNQFRGRVMAVCPVLGIDPEVPLQGGRLLHLDLLTGDWLHALAEHIGDLRVVGHHFLALCRFASIPDWCPGVVPGNGHKGILHRGEDVVIPLLAAPHGASLREFPGHVILGLGCHKIAQIKEDLPEFILAGSKSGFAAIQADGHTTLGLFQHKLRAFGRNTAGNLLALHTVIPGLDTGILDIRCVFLTIDAGDSDALRQLVVNGRLGDGDGQIFAIPALREHFEHIRRCDVQVCRQIVLDLIQRMQMLGAGVLQGDGVGIAFTEVGCVPSVGCLLSLHYRRIGCCNVGALGFVLLNVGEAEVLGCRHIVAQPELLILIQVRDALAHDHAVTHIHILGEGGVGGVNVAVCLGPAEGNVAILRQGNVQVGDCGIPHRQQGLQLAVDGHCHLPADLFVVFHVLPADPFAVGHSVGDTVSPTELLAVLTFGEGQNVRKFRPGHGVVAHSAWCVAAVSDGAQLYLVGQVEDGEGAALSAVAAELGLYPNLLGQIKVEGLGLPGQLLGHVGDGLLFIVLLDLNPDQQFAALGAVGIPIGHRDLHRIAHLQRLQLHTVDVGIGELAHVHLILVGVRAFGGRSLKFLLSQSQIEGFIGVREAEVDIRGLLEAFALPVKVHGGSCFLSGVEGHIALCCRILLGARGDGHSDAVSHHFDLVLGGLALAEPFLQFRGQAGIFQDTLTHGQIFVGEDLLCLPDGGEAVDAHQGRTVGHTAVCQTGDGLGRLEHQRRQVRRRFQCAGCHADNGNSLLALVRCGNYSRSSELGDTSGYMEQCGRTVENLIDRALRIHIVAAAGYHLARHRAQIAQGICGKAGVHRKVVRAGKLYRRPAGVGFDGIEERRIQNVHTGIYNDEVYFITICESSSENTL